MKLPRSTLILICLIPLLGCDGSPHAVPAVVSTPSLPVPTLAALAKDFGEVPAGRRLEHRFTFRNDSSETIRLAANGVRRNCDCAAFEVETQSVLPGSEATISVSVETIGRRGPIAIGGETAWTAASGKLLICQTLIRANVLDYLLVDPEQVSLSSADVADGRAQSVRVTTRPGVRLLALAAAKAVDQGGTQARLVPQPDGSHLLEVTYQQITGGNDAGGRLLLSAKIKEEGRPDALDLVQVVPVKVQLPVPLSVIPDRIALSRHKARTKAIRFVIRGQVLVVGTRLVAVRADGATCTWQARPANSHHAIHAECWLKPMPDRQQGSLSFERRNPQGNFLLRGLLIEESIHVQMHWQSVGQNAGRRRPSGVRGHHRRAGGRPPPGAQQMLCGGDLHILHKRIQL